MTEAQDTGHRGIEARIIARAWKDPAFAADLRRNPRAAIQRELAAMNVDLALPPGVDIKVVEETADTMYLVVPEKPEGAAELSQASLTRIAGGGSLFCPTLDVKCEKPTPD